MVLKSGINKSFETQKSFLKKRALGEPRNKIKRVVLSASHILIITGIRRCGKSTMMHQLMQEVSDRVFFNFEDPRIFGFDVADFPKLNEVLGEDKQHYFFDEIQNVSQWELFIRNLHDQQKTICITGSNASLLSKELGTRLTGRNIQVELFPFSYVEYCSFKKLSYTASSYRSYLDIGGFPDYVKNKQPEQLQQLFRDIVYRDIVVRYGVRNSKTLIEIALFLISNAGKEYSLTKIKNTFGVGSTNSVASYMQWFEDSYLLFSLPRFSWSLKSVAINAKKVYTIDTGFAQANSLSFMEDIGRLFENSVYLQLRRKYKDLYYFREKGECDFVVRQGKEILHLIQVCAEVTTDNMDREVNGLFEAMTYFEKHEGVIVTLDQSDEVIKEDRKIVMVPAHQWFGSFD